MGISCKQLRRARWFQAMVLAVVFSLLIGCAGGAAPSGGVSTLVPLEIPMADMPLSSSPVVGGLGSSVSQTDSDDEEANDVGKAWYKAISNGVTLTDVKNCSDDPSSCVFDSETSQGYCQAMNSLGSMVTTMAGADFNLCVLRHVVADAPSTINFEDGTSRYIEFDYVDTGATSNNGLDLSDILDGLHLQMTVNDANVPTLADFRTCKDGVQQQYYRHLLNDNAFELEQKMIGANQQTHVELTSTVDGNAKYVGEKNVVVRNIISDENHWSRREFTQTEDMLTISSLDGDEETGGDIAYTSQVAQFVLSDSNSSTDVDDYNPMLLGGLSGADKAQFQIVRDAGGTSTVQDTEEWTSADGSVVANSGDYDISEDFISPSVITIASFADDGQSATCGTNYDVTIQVTDVQMQSYFSSCSNYDIEDIGHVGCSDIIGDEARMIAEDDFNDSEEFTELAINSVTAMRSGVPDSVVTLGQSSGAPETLDASIVTIDIEFAEAYDESNIQFGDNVIFETTSGTAISMGTMHEDGNIFRIVTSETLLQSGESYQLRIVGSDDLADGIASITADGDDATRITTTQTYYLTAE